MTWVNESLFSNYGLLLYLVHCATAPLSWVAPWLVCFSEKHCYCGSHNYFKCDLFVCCAVHADVLLRGRFLISWSHDSLSASSTNKATALVSVMDPSDSPSPVLLAKPQMGVCTGQSLTWTSLFIVPLSKHTVYSQSSKPREGPGWDYRIRCHTAAHLHLTEEMSFVSVTGRDATKLAGQEC